MNLVDLFFTEKKFLEIETEVKDGNLTRFESILKILTDPNINDSLIKEHPKFCYRCIKLLPFVSSKLTKGLAQKVVLICVNKGIFKKITTEKNLGLDCIEGKKYKTVKIDIDLFTLLNDSFNQQYLHLINSGPRSNDGLYHLDFKKYDFVVVEALKTYFYEGVLSEKLNKANLKYIFQFLQLATEIKESGILNFCLTRLEEIYKLLSEDELSYVLAQLPSFFKEDVVIKTHFNIMEMYAERHNFEFETYIEGGIVSKNSKIAINARHIQIVADLKILDGEKSIHKLFQTYCNAIFFHKNSKNDKLDIGEIMLSLLMVSKEIRDKIDTILMKPKTISEHHFAGEYVEVYLLDYFTIIRHILTSWSLFSTIKNIIFDGDFKKNKSGHQKFTEGFVTLQRIEYGTLRTIGYFDPSNIEETMKFLK